MTVRWGEEGREPQLWGGGGSRAVLGRPAQGQPGGAGCKDPGRQECTVPHRGAP